MHRDNFDHAGVFRPCVCIRVVAASVETSLCSLHPAQADERWDFRAYAAGLAPHSIAGVVVLACCTMGGWSVSLPSIRDQSNKCEKERKCREVAWGRHRHNLSKLEIEEAGATSFPLPAAPVPARRAASLDPPWRCGVSVRVSGGSRWCNARRIAEVYW
jgi:hypothetical protein